MVRTKLQMGLLQHFMALLRMSMVQTQSVMGKLLLSLNRLTISDQTRAQPVLHMEARVPPDRRVLQVQLGQHMGRPDQLLEQLQQIHTVQIHQTKIK